MKNNPSFIVVFCSGKPAEKRSIDFSLIFYRLSLNRTMKREFAVMSVCYVNVHATAEVALTLLFLFRLSMVE